MPQVKFERVVSCSSEDPVHPAKNLLLSRNYSRKWRCKEPGADSVSVIIQLNEPCVITGVDIGNESSSFVEVLVSRTSSPDNFQVLLLMSSFMTPMDARNETNKHRVRMFSHDDLSDPVRKEKWDRIKVVCTQPFNKHLQYGLSFIVLHTNESKPEAPPTHTTPVKKTFGRFALKDDDDDNDISVGSFFSRRKDLLSSPPPAPAPLTGAAAVRDAASPANLAEQLAAKKRKGSNDLTDSQKKKRGRPVKEAKSTEDASPSTSAQKAKPTKIESPSQADETSRKHKNKIDERDDKAKSPLVINKTKKTPRKTSSDDDPGPSNATTSSTQDKHSNQRQPTGPKGNITYKPFNKLFEDVEIVISGYENPGRTHIRDKALEMGAKYSGPWRSSSTHLICAFANTPKFQEVQGRGIIVTRDWVDDCHRERKKLSWRRYTTVVADRKDANNSSEPEVWELIPEMNASSNSPLPPASRRNNIAARDTRLGSDSEDSEDEIERIRSKLKRKELGKESKKHTDENIEMKPKKADTKDSENEAYNGSTDVDSEEEVRNRLAEWSEKQTKARREKLPPLPDFFKDKTFFLSNSLSEVDRQSLSRYIIAFGGEVLQSQDKSVHYVISDKKCGMPEGARLVCVTPQWIWECNDRQKFISPSLYKPE